MTKLKPGWKLVKFGEVVRHVKTKINPETSGLERFVAGEHMDTDDLRIRRWGTIGDGYLGPAFHMHFKPGQVLYGSRRTYLRKVAIADFEGICANTTFVLEPVDPTKLLPSFLPFLMQTESFHEHSKRESKGSVNPYVNFSDLAWYEFALPPIEEQRRMAKILEQATRAVEFTYECIEKLDVLACALRDNLFENLPTRKLKNLVARIETGSSPNGTDKPPNINEFGVLRVSAVSKHGFLPNESKTIIEPSSFDQKRTIKKGDLLITRANTSSLVGMSCIAHETFDNLMLSDKTLRLIPENGIKNTYLLQSLWCSHVRKQLQSLSTGTGAAMKNISQEKLLNVEIPWLPIDRQPQALEAINATIAARTAIHLRAMAAQCFRDSMLNELWG